MVIRHPEFTRIVQQLPSTVPFTAPEQLERESGYHMEMRLGANESPFGVSPKAQEAMRESMREAMWYGDPESYRLRQALEQKFGFGLQNTVVASGIDELLGLILRIFLEPGDPVVASKGAYPTFLYHVDGYGGSQHLVPYIHYLNDLDGLAKAAHEHKAKVVYLANPDNPTGTYYTGDEIQSFVGELPEECLFLLDEAYTEFAPPDIHLPAAFMDPRIVRLRTFSKVYGLAGARIGYAIAHPDIIAAVDKTRNHFGVNRMAQAGALASLHDTAFLEKVIQETAEGRQEYYNLAQALDYAAVESVTNFVAIDVGDEETAQMLVDRMWQRGIFIRKPGVAPLNQCIRVTVGTKEQRSALADALESIRSSMY